jgi:hypothetical protein
MKLCAYCNLPAPKGRKRHSHCTQASKRLTRRSFVEQMQTGTIVGLELARVINQPKEVR